MYGCMYGCMYVFMHACMYGCHFFGVYDSMVFFLSENMTTRAACKSKEIYGKWSTAAMEAAVDAYTSGLRGLCQSSMTYGVPKATLLCHANNGNKFANGPEKHFGQRSGLPVEIEAQLEEHLGGTFLWLNKKGCT